jgi:DNA-binding SARP family transcriptional activator
VILFRTGLASLDVEHQAKAGDDETRAWAIDDVLDGVLTTTGAEIAEIFLRARGASGVSLAGFRGPFPEAFAQITSFEEGQGYAGLVVSEGLPLRVTDALSDGRFLRTRVKQEGFRYFLCVPIPGRDRPVGSLHVAWRRGSADLFSHCLTLSREAERLALILDREVRVYGAVGEAKAPEAEQRLDLRLLGSFEARLGGIPLSMDRFARRRALTLLKILVTNYGKVVVRDELIELLWPSDPPKDAIQLLKTAVHYLRRALGEEQNGKTKTSFISTEANGYAFNPASLHRLDAIEFKALAEEGLRFERQGRWREAVVALRSAADLYSGDYLEDDPYSDWSLKQRRQLRETLFDVLHATARLLRSAGDDEAAIRCYRRILDLDPCLEDVHRDLMEVLCRCGKRTQALRQFEECRRALREEFDSSPLLETEALYRSILAGLSG